MAQLHQDGRIIQANLEDCVKYSGRRIELCTVTAVFPLSEGAPDKLHDTPWLEDLWRPKVTIVSDGHMEISKITVSEDDLKIYVQHFTLVMHAHISSSLLLLNVT